MILPGVPRMAVAALLGAVVVCPACLNGDAAPSPDAKVAAAASAAADTVELHLDIAGMTCGSCAQTARIVLERTPGVFGAEVSYADSHATVRYDAAATSPAKIVARLEEFTGYVAKEAEARGS